jgi:hypothetical protein
VEFTITDDISDNTIECADNSLVDLELLIRRVLQQRQQGGVGLGGLVVRLGVGSNSIWTAQPNLV